MAPTALTVLLHRRRCVPHHWRRKVRRPLPRHQVNLRGLPARTAPPFSPCCESIMSAFPGIVCHAPCIWLSDHPSHPRVLSILQPLLQQYSCRIQRCGHLWHAVRHRLSELDRARRRRHRHGLHEFVHHRQSRYAGSQPDLPRLHLHRVGVQPVVQHWLYRTGGGPGLQVLTATNAKGTSAPATSSSFVTIASI